MELISGVLNRFRTPRKTQDVREKMKKTGRTFKQILRPWIIQCKRYKRIGPKEIKTIFSDFFKKNTAKPYGYILVAPCEFSMKTRKQFSLEVSKRGITEGYVIGKGELEDILLRPQNDHLLFAYFGISLQVRKRSLQTVVRSEIALKKALVKHVSPIEEPHGERWVFIRDPANKEYPRPKNEEVFEKNPAWKYWRFLSHQAPNKIAFVKRMCFAYLDEKEEGWDAFLDYDLEIFQELSQRNIWTTDIDREQEFKLRSIWNEEIPDKTQAWYFEIAIIPYERILGVDPLGDTVNKGTHLLVSYSKNGSPFEETTYPVISRSRTLEEFFRVREITRVDTLEKARVQFELEAAKPKEVRKKELISLMSSLKPMIVNEAVNFYSSTVFNLAGNVVSAPGNRPLGSDREKLSKLKSDIVALQKQSKRIITEAFSGETIWWHENLEADPESMYSDKIPTPIEEALRISIGKVAPILRGHGFLGQNDFWKKPTERGYYSQSSQPDYSNHHFEYPENFLKLWKKYSKSFAKYKSLSRTDPFEQRERENESILKLWKDE